VRTLPITLVHHVPVARIPHPAPRTPHPAPRTQALVKFNESLASNKRLREQIESLRQERSVFDSVYKRMETQLAEKKRQVGPARRSLSAWCQVLGAFFWGSSVQRASALILLPQMAAIIEASNQAYEARDAAQLEIAAVQQSLARERQQYEEAIIELNRCALVTLWSCASHAASACATMWWMPLPLVFSLTPLLHGARALRLHGFLFRPVPSCAQANRARVLPS
jgi:hypothetical protein